MDGAGRGSDQLGRGRVVRVVLLLLTLLLPVTTAHAQGALENPGAGSVRSGVGVFSGWKCSAASPTSITLTIDDLPALQAAYGTARDDTTGVCGDANNGYGLLFNFGLLADGDHEVVAADAGVEFARASFTTSKFGANFLTGAIGTTFVRDFPEQDQGAFMIWQQATQSFTVGGTCGQDGKVACPPPYPNSAWLYADQETAAGPYTPADSINSSGHPIQVTRTGVGAYSVTLSGLAVGTDQDSGVAHVTARQGNANFCVVQDWEADDAFARVVRVLCYDAAGAAADTRFDLAFSRPAAGNEVRGYLWADAPDQAAYVPSLLYQYNAAGPLAAAERVGIGTYRAYLPGLSTDGEVGFMVSAYGNEPRRCRVLFAGIHDDQRFGVDVACEDAAGALADSRFTLSVIRRTPLVSMVYNVLGAYLRTINPTVPAVAEGDAGYNEASGTNSVTRTATGRYVARIGNLSFYPEGNVQVTAVGEGASHCTIESIVNANPNLEVTVLCFDGATPANSEFALTFTR